MDYVKAAAWLALVSGSCLIVAASVLALQNRASSNVVFATAALVGTAIFYFLQLVFELQGSTSTEVINAELTIDREKREVHNWSTNHHPPFKYAYEQPLNKWLSLQPISEVRSNEVSLIRDAILVSTLSLFQWEEPDWQMKEKRVSSRRVAHWTRGPDSSEGAYERVLLVSIGELLKKSGNLIPADFAEGGRKELHLPPSSNISIGRTNISIRSPFCEISFEFEEAEGMHFEKPGDETRPMMTNGEPRFVTYVVPTRVTTRFLKLRTHHPERSDYENWTKRLIVKARLWLES